MKIYYRIESDVAILTGGVTPINPKIYYRIERSGIAMTLMWSFD